MTDTADSVFAALVCDEGFSASLGGDSAWAELLGDAVPLTPGFGVASRVDGPPTVLEV